MDRIGLPGATLTAAGPDGQATEKRELQRLNASGAVEQLIDFLANRLGRQRIWAIGHRVVHGGSIC